jgi:2-oxoglutarate dehydrogenase E1 component
MSLESTPLYAGNADFLDTLYEQYQRDPASVAPGWRALFDSWGAPVPEFPSARPAPGAGGAVDAPQPSADGAASAKQAAVSRLIQIWTNRGHLLANLDPLGLMQRPRPRVLDLDYSALRPAILKASFLPAAAPRRSPGG